jgi:hypothetical protein
VTTYLVDSPSQTVDDIVSNVVASTRLPLSQVTFSQAQIIAMMQDEQQTKIVPLIKKVREDYWLTNYDQQIITGVFAYGMPPRCSGGALRDFVFVDPSGYEIDCPHLDPDQLKTPSYFAFRPSWQGQGAFLQNDQLMLWPQTNSNVSYKLRQKYERRANSLTSSVNCAQITAVDSGANTITFAASPPTPPFSIGTLIDIISITGQHVSQGDNFLISNVMGSVVTFDPSTPIGSTVTVGSWACAAGLTCIPQVPDEAYPILLARGMMRIATALQNSNLMNVATKLAEDAYAEIETLFTPRVPGSPRKFVNKNTVGGPYSFPYYR